MTNAALLLMSTVIAAQPIGPASWVQPQDFSPNIVKGRNGEVRFVLAISATGIPISCAVAISSGWNDLDERACVLMLRRGRFQPARDMAGEPTAAVYRNRVTWWVGDGYPPKPAPLTMDIELTVAGLPEGVKNPTWIDVAMVVEADGKISACSPMLPQPAAKPTSKKGKVEQRAINLLGPTACARATQTWGPSAFVDETGKAARSIQVARVSFSTGPAAR